MSPKSLRELLESFSRNEVEIETVIEYLQAYAPEDLGFAKLDHHRSLRTGYPEVIYGEGKTPSQIADIFERLSLRHHTVLCTRASAQAAQAVQKKLPQASYHKVPRLIELRCKPVQAVGGVVVACAGTSDLPVAEEAAIVLEAFGSRVERIYDAGVAGLHRLLAQTPVLRRANCIVAVAGMEGAMPSVIAGLVDVPVIAVPTSVGYGVNLKGITALLSMLSSCASGISVVNIDNGFGAGFQADMINKLAVGTLRKNI
ncbi:MAG: nickel pincer cofactor biosynthesis protein LarB [Desulfobacteraceae bacterium]|jgi:hypothetical protein